MESSPFRDGMTLREAKEILRELVEEGHRCPCCFQFAKVYKRKVHAGMAAALIRLYRTAGPDWVEIATVLPHNQIADTAKLRYWGLVEQQNGLREDGSDRIGWWRVGMKGAAWVERRNTISKYAHLYDGRCMGFSGDQVTIIDALGKRFRYDDLMRGE